MREFFKTLYLIILGMIFTLLMLNFLFPYKDSEYSYNLIQKTKWQKEEIRKVIEETRG